MLGQLVIGGGKDQILASDDKQKQIPGGLVAQDGENEVPKVLEENSAKCFFMISVLGSLQTPRPRPVCVPGPPPRPELPWPLLGKHAGGWHAHWGTCCCPPIRHVDEIQYLSLPQGSGVPKAQIQMSRTVGSVPNKRRMILNRARPRPEHQPSPPAANTRPQHEWQARPRGPQSWAPAAWSPEEHAGTPTQGRSSGGKSSPPFVNNLKTSPL